MQRKAVQLSQHDCASSFFKPRKRKSFTTYFVNELLTIVSWTIWFELNKPTIEQTETEKNAKQDVQQNNEQIEWRNVIFLPVPKHLGAQIRNWSMASRVLVNNASKKLLLTDLTTRCVFNRQCRYED